jgi:hypothetical protein
MQGELPSNEAAETFGAWPEQGNGKSTASQKQDRRNLMNRPESAPGKA